MILPDKSDRYSAISITLHWLMFLVMAAAFATIELRVNFERGSDIREGLKHWHFMLGLSVLLLVIVRIIARLATAGPRTVAEPLPSKLLAKGTHLALYALMIGLPLAGWTILSASDAPVPFFGLELPPLVSPDKALAKQVKELHELGGTIAYWLIGFHALAALIHHYVLKDGVLLRMRPGRG
ncbi:cytochrome b [Novosphingobium sp.]|uniref:cytochrome b n=1 Tax=Novosphingobium sp. TaxID=1874826 RepID=UPI002735CEB1|nr:cytochrome b [Novosphingobium sp.]MDP3905755.1 cytochrome b [Novosphingobium sp.]